jgi:hypothetical protein
MDDKIACEFVDAVETYQRRPDGKIAVWKTFRTSPFGVFVTGICVQSKIDEPMTWDGVVSWARE